MQLIKHCLFLYMNRVLFIHLSILCMLKPVETLSCLFMMCGMSLDFHGDRLWNKTLYILDTGIKYPETVRCDVLCQSTLILRSGYYQCSAPLASKLQHA